MDAAPRVAVKTSVKVHRLVLGERRDVIRNNTRIVSIFGIFDPHIPGGSSLAGAHNIVLETGGHFRILGDRNTIAIVRDAVAETTETTG